MLNKFILCKLPYLSTFHQFFRLSYAFREEILHRIEKIAPFNTTIGINIGKNKATSLKDSILDYQALIENFKDVADYFVVNISSPNTPGLRDLQNEEFIKEIFKLTSSLTRKPVLLKIAPDMPTQNAIELSIIAIESGASGIMATNTTIDYDLLPEVSFKELGKKGGLSGKVLKEKSYKLFQTLGKELYKDTTLISVGGIDSAKEAYSRIKAGASLIQIYSSFIFQGPALARDINLGLITYLKRDGFNHISEAIGIDYK